jgi:hypothetical protein
VAQAQANGAMVTVWWDDTNQNKYRSRSMIDRLNNLKRLKRNLDPVAHTDSERNFAN